MAGGGACLPLKTWTTLTWPAPKLTDDEVERIAKRVVELLLEQTAVRVPEGK